MQSPGRFRNHLRSLLWKKSVAAEVESELSFHVEMRTRELIRRGVDPKEARARALGRFGNNWSRPPSMPPDCQGERF